MGAYKDYIDRISLDEEQHEKLLQAIREAETEKNADPSRRRKRLFRSPLKTMGRRVSHEPHATGSVQKNFINADYLLYPNEYMMKHMIED